MIAGKRNCKNNITKIDSEEKEKERNEDAIGEIGEQEKDSMNNNNNKNKMTAASMAVQETPLKLLSDLPTEIPKVKLNIPTVGGNTEKREAPTSNGDSVELHFLCAQGV